MKFEFQVDLARGRGSGWEMVVVGRGGGVPACETGEGDGVS